MKKIFLAIFFPLAAVSAVTADGPRLEFAQYETDLGVFDADSMQTARITVRNTGNDTLVIFHVHTECRCTRPADYSKVIAPGDSTVMTVTYNGRGHSPGRIRQALRVRSNSPEPYRTCYIIGEIRRKEQK